MKPVGAIVVLADMPRYYFHLYNDVVVIDEEGVELPDIGTVWRRAEDIARRMICESVKDGELKLDDRIEVADERGDVLLRMKFRDAFKLVG